MVEQQGQSDAEPQAATPTKSRMGLWLALMMVFCALLTIGALVAYNRCHGGFITLGYDDKPHVITIMSPWVTQALAYLMVGGLVTMVLLAIVAIFRKLPGRAVVSIAAAVLLGGGWILVLGASGLSMSWAVVDQCPGADGNQYAYVDQNMFTEDWMVLGRESGRDALGVTYDMLGEVHADCAFWTAVVRPASCDGWKGRLLLSPGGWLVGLRDDNDCHFAYEVATGKFLSDKEIAQVSPLILIGPDTEPLATDVRAILSAGDEVPGGAGRIVADLRAEAEAHPNAKIREMFKAMPEASTKPSEPAGPGASSRPTGSVRCPAGRRENATAFGVRRQAPQGRTRRFSPPGPCASLARSLGEDRPRLVRFVTFGKSIPLPGKSGEGAPLGLVAALHRFRVVEVFSSLCRPLGGCIVGHT